MTDTLENLGDMFGLDAEAPPEQVQAEPVEATPAEDPAIQPETQQPEPEVLQEPEPKEPHVVPLATFLDKRDEAKELKRQLAEAKQQLQSYQQPQQPVDIPDPYEKPKEYQAYVQSQIADQAFNMRLDMSGQFAEQQHGKDKVEAAVAWAQEQGQSDPTFGVRLRNQPNPVGWVVDQYNREQFFTQYGSDPSALAALSQGAPQANQGLVAPQPAAPAMMPSAVTPKPVPPRSLATAPSSGAMPQTAQSGEIFKSLKFNLD